MGLVQQAVALLLMTCCQDLLILQQLVAKVNSRHISEPTESCIQYFGLPLLFSPAFSDLITLYTAVFFLGLGILIFSLSWRKFLVFEKPDDIFC